jgi:hypothetical protein
MYKHWRYQPAGTDRRYPFYARTHRRFQRLLAAGAGRATAPARS